ncbi:GCN5-related N-acetyltransferase [Calothrix brevissima NIES-22]|nr:GCN5-related N-acetyltransferase [Calothrix brevissima NIES-22]
MIHINLAQSDAEIERCFPTMQLLRPHLVASEFVTRIRRQQVLGFVPQPNLPPKKGD